MVNLEKLTEDNPVYLELLEASYNKNPKKTLQEVVDKYRGQPYEEDMIGKAKTMLDLREHYKKKQYQ